MRKFYSDQYQVELDEFQGRPGRNRDPVQKFKVGPT